MAQITKLFTKGLDTDTAPHLQEKESYSSAMNVHFSLGSLLGVNDGTGTNMSGYNIGGDLGVLEPFAGNTDWTELFSTLGVTGYDQDGAKCIGYAVDDTESLSSDKRFIYIFIYTPDFTVTPLPPAPPYSVSKNSWIVKIAIKYNSSSKVNTISIADSSILLNSNWILSSSVNALGFEPTYFISARTNGTQLIWTDGHNAIRYVDVTKNYYVNQPNLEELSLITEPGHVPLTSLRGTDSSKALIIQKKGLQFTYRITNEDNLISVLSPYSLTSLPPWQEQLDANNYTSNVVTVDLSKKQKIPSNWKKIDIVVRFLDTNVFQVIRTFNKYDTTVRYYNMAGGVYFTDADLITAHNDPALLNIHITYQNWDGTNIVETLDPAYCAKEFDNVPITSQSLELASNRLLVANNLEGYDTPNTPIAFSSTPSLTDSFTTPDVAEPVIYQQPIFVAVKSNGTDSWSWCVVTQKLVSGTYSYYGYPLDCSVGLFISNYVPTVASALGDFNSQNFPGGVYSTTNFMTLPQEVSIKNMVNINYTSVIPLTQIFNRYPTTVSETNLVSSIMSQMNPAYSGVWADTTQYATTFPQMIVVPYKQIQSSPSNDCTIIQASTYNVSSLNRFFLPGTSYSYGATFYDEALRKCGIQRLGSVDVPEYYPNTRTLYQSLEFDLNSSQILPSWAKYYSIDVSKNNTYSTFISFVPDIIRFAYKDKNNLVVFDQNERTTKYIYYGIAIPISSLNKDGIGYAYTEGDICKLVMYNTTTSTQQIFSGSVIDQQSGYIIVSIPQAAIKDYLSLQDNYQSIILNSTGSVCLNGLTSSTTKRYQSKCFAYIATPQSLANQEYEVAAFGEVINSTTLGNFYSTGTLTYKLNGDTYTQSRDANGGSLTCVSMNPYEKTYTQWLTDLGRYSPIDTVGQKRLTNQIRWSNAKIPQTQTNGLSSFDALDVTDVDGSAGPITSIILSSKEANLASRIVILCNSGSFIGLVGQAQIYSQDQTTAFLSSAPVIGTIQPITGQWGCISPQGVISYKGMVFWADALNREIIQLAGDGATPISQQKAGFLWNQVFRNLPFNDSTNSAKNIKLGINPYTSEVFVTCPNPNLTAAVFPANSGENRLNQYIPNKNVSYTYNYQLNKWVGAYESNPDQWIRVGDDVFSIGFHYGLQLGLNLYKEFDAAPGHFNQLVDPKCYISFPVSEGYPATIEPLSVILMGQLETDSTVIYARDSSSTVNNNLTQVTSWNDSNYSTREGEKFAPVLRNRLSNNANQSQVLTISPLVTGSGYLTAPLVTIGPPTVSGGTQATAIAVLTGGSVTSYIITNPGTGYTSVPSISVAPPPTGVTATATLTVGVAAKNTYDYQGIKGDRIRSKTPWVQVTFPAEQQINFQGVRVEVKPSSGH